MGRFLLALLIMTAAGAVIFLAVTHTVRIERATAEYAPGKYIDYIESDTLRPAVLFIHGGGWAFGNRTACADWCEAFSDDYDTYACDYTLATEGAPPPWEQTVADIAAAVDWIQNRKGIRQIFLVGYSAGGHLALYHAKHHRDVHGVVAISAPTDLEGRFNESVEQNVRLWAGDDAEDASIRARPTMPPICIIHGTHDGVVPVKHADMLVQQCLDAGVDFSYHRFHGGTHCMEERQQITNRLIRKFLAEITL